MCTQGKVEFAKNASWSRWCVLLNVTQKQHVAFFSEKIRSRAAVKAEIIILKSGRIVNVYISLCVCEEKCCILDTPKVDESLTVHVARVPSILFNWKKFSWPYKNASSLLYKDNKSHLQKEVSLIYLYFSCAHLLMNY